jgi:hypothetical protein
MTEIKVDFAKKAANPREMGEAFGKLLGIMHGNERVRLKSQGPLEIREMTAYEAVFEVRPQPAGLLYYDVVVCPVAAGGELTFVLVVDSSRYTARAPEFKRILRTLQVR